MTNQILVPSLGESITEATVSKWLKQVGEKVSSDEPLVELETDKVNVEVPSPLSGTLSSIKVKEGDTVEVGALLGLVSEGKSGSTKKSQDEEIVQEKQSYKPPKKIQPVSKKKIVEKTNNEPETLSLDEEVVEEQKDLYQTLRDFQEMDPNQSRKSCAPTNKIK